MQYYILQAKDLAKGKQQFVMEIVKRFEASLKKHNYYAVYFDRTSQKQLCLCDSEGWFECEGLYNKQKCMSKHRINPYGSLEERIIFSTWNLDHG